MEYQDALEQGFTKLYCPDEKKCINDVPEVGTPVEFITHGQAQRLGRTVRVTDPLNNTFNAIQFLSEEGELFSEDYILYYKIIHQTQQDKFELAKILNAAGTMRKHNLIGLTIDQIREIVPGVNLERYTFVKATDSVPEKQNDDENTLLLGIDKNNVVRRIM